MGATQSPYLRRKVREEDKKLGGKEDEENQKLTKPFERENNIFIEWLNTDKGT